VIDTVGVGYGPIGTAVSPDGSRAYVTTILGSVSVIDTATNAVVDTVGVGPVPQGLAITANGAHVYVTSFASNSVSVVDTATNAVVTAVAVGAGPYMVAITPGIGPPTNKDQCKRGGWKAFTIPGKFKNQGHCVSFVNTRK
jgi:YVTN family beta-propeller protein